MHSPRVISVAAALAPLLLGWPGVSGPAVAAEAATASARLEVHALPDCTTREELVARVAARSRRIHFDDEAPGPTLRAIIAPGPRGGAVGELQIAEPSGKVSTRRLSAPSCAEATDALALIIALTLDPTAASAAAPAGANPPAAPATRPPTESRAPGPAAPASTSPSSAAPTGRPASAPSSEVARPSAPAPRIQPPADEAGAALVVAAPERPVAARTRFGGGVAGEVVLGPAPGALPGLSLYLMAALDRDALWSPAAIVRGTHAWQSGIEEGGGTAAFTLDALTLDACLLRLAGPTFEARACVSALYGRLAASGTETYSPATADRPYAAAGAALVFSAQPTRLLELTGRVGGGASLVRDSFAFSPEVFHRTAAATLAASLGIGVRFP